MMAGFSNSDVSVHLPDNESTREFAHEKNTKAPEGTTTGVAAGGTIGGTLGLLAGIGALAIPGVGPFIAAGPIMGALAALAWAARLAAAPRCVSTVLAVVQSIWTALPTSPLSAPVCVLRSPVGNGPA